MSFVTAALVVGGSSLLGGYMASQGAQAGAQTQANAMNRSADLQKQMFDVQNAQQAPYRQSGYNALNQIGALGSGTYGIYDKTGNVTGQGTGSGYLTQQFGPEQFAAGIDPGYAFRLQQGQMANKNMSNQAGGMIGGNALKGLQDYTQGQASQEYGNAFNRFQTQRGNIYNSLASIAGLGQTSLGQTSALSGQTAQGMGSAIAGAGSAIGAGQVASGNAIGGGITGAGNGYMLSQMLAQRNPLSMQVPSGYGSVVPQSIYSEAG